MNDIKYSKSVRIPCIDGTVTQFWINVTSRSECHVEGNVEEVIGWECDGKDTPCMTEHYLKFYMKWDGCCHVWFPDNNMLHLCGADAWDKHASIMLTLYAWAQDYIPMEKDVSGEFPYTIPTTTLEK